MPDFFVSYNKIDRQSAEWIAWQLESAGYSVVIQAWDFRPGSNFVLEMNRAAQEAQRTIAVLSPDYVVALYTQPEWAAAFAQDPVGRSRTLIGVLVREVELQGLLSQIIYINLVGLDEEAARSELLNGLKLGRAKPKDAPIFPFSPSSQNKGVFNEEHLDEQSRSGTYAAPFLPQTAVLPPGFRVSVDNFLDTYLGPPDEPAPFGGRTEDIKRLNDWLDHDNAPYLCISTEAGRGKSALLVQWTAKLLGRQDLFVIFIPVSIRFETNTSSIVFGALASLLADYGDEAYPMLGAIPPIILKDLCREYISRGSVNDRTLLIILDGVDEAADWEATNLFPFSPPLGLRVVISARNKVETPEPSAWLRELGWDRQRVGKVFPLEPLTEAGVVEVLQSSSIGTSEAIAETTLAKQIYRVSEGDPLLISLYVADFKNKSAQQQDISLLEIERMPAGLDAYFTRWLEEQRKLWGSNEDWRDNSLQLVLSALACALGPLLRDDILALAPSGVNLDSWHLNEILRPLGRLLVGDGRNHGVTFVHPRLGTYFREKRLSQSERSHWEFQFVLWGQETLQAIREHRLSPKEVPPYLIKFYGEHLRRTATNTSDLYALLCEEWLAASSALEGTPALFLDDALRAWDVARREGVGAVGVQLRAALCFSSVASSTTKVSADLLIFCVKRNIVSHALAIIIARQKPEPHEKVECLSALAELLPLDKRPALISDALRTADEIWQKDKRATALVQVAARLPPDEQQAVYEQAHDLMKQLSSASIYYVLKNTEHLWPAGALSSLANDVLKAARRDANLWQRAWVMEAISKMFNSPERESILKEAFDAAVGEPQSDHIQAIALSALAFQLPEDERQAQLNQAFKLAKAIDYDWTKIHALRDVALALPSTRLEDVLEVARSVGNEIARSELLADLAALLPSNQQMAVYSEALQIAQGVKDDWIRAGALKRLITRLPNRFLIRITESAWAIENKWAQAEVLETLAPRLSGKEQEKALKLAIVVSQDIADDADRAFTLAQIIPMISEGQDETFSEAWELARSSWEHQTRAAALMELAKCVDDERRHTLLSEALDAASSIENEPARADALINLLPSLCPQLLNRVFALAQITPEDRNSYLQHRILKALRQYAPDELLSEALECIQTMVITPESYRTSLLSEFIPYLKSGPQHQALRWARTTMDSPDLAKSLLAVATSLPRGKEQLYLLEEALTLSQGLDLSWIENKVITARIYLQLAIRSGNAKRDYRLARALELFRSIQYQPSQYELFGELFPHLPEEEAESLLEEVLSVARTETYSGNRARHVGRLGVQLHGERRERVLKETLDIIAVMNAEHVHDQAMVLEEFAKNLPDSLLQRALDITWTLGYDYHVPRILGALGLRWEALCGHNKGLEFQRLSKTLDTYRGCKREYMLEIVRALLPVVARLGGAHAISDTLSAIRDTAKWWP